MSFFKTVFKVRSTMGRCLIFLLAFVCLASTDPLFDLFRNLDTLKRINTHNANPNRTFDMEFNDISALSQEDFEKRLGLWNPDALSNADKRFEKPSNFIAPDEIDWRDYGAVSQVKDQGECGSCWAFSAVGALEGQHVLRRNGSILELSEQNLVDCSGMYGNEGCAGGWMNNSFNYVMDNGGIDTESSYPYVEHGEKCHFNKSSVGETDYGFVEIQRGNEEELKNAVASIGPISVAIEVLGSFYKYKNGVYYDKRCSATYPSHAVLVVGYGTDPKGGDYWLVKNSWGPKWGDNGYIKMARNRNNHCGIANWASYPIVK